MGIMSSCFCSILFLSSFLLSWRQARSQPLHQRPQQVLAVVFHLQRKLLADMGFENHIEALLEAEVGRSRTCEHFKGRTYLPVD